MKNNSLKYERSSMRSIGMKQENLATDLAGNLENISLMRSIGMKTEFSPLLMLSSQNLKENLFFRKRRRS